VFSDSAGFDGYGDETVAHERGEAETQKGVAISNVGSSLNGTSGMTASNELASVDLASGRMR
jgi:hypothetical protein